LETIRLSYSVPYYAQVASPDLAAQIFGGQMPPEQDPRWAESGAETPDEYAYWVERACGVACVQMCVKALGGPSRTLVDWAREGVAIGGYLIETGPDGLPRERGWIHKALAALIEREGFFAEPRPADSEEIAAQLGRDRMVIASVSYEVGTHEPVTKRGGHLVVITGLDRNARGVTAFVINNPSGRTPNMQLNACIPAERFLSGYTGRVIVVGRK
jgi:hypothetical protein